VHCGPGTYIRSLARDIGAHLGCGAHLAALRRHGSGTFRIEDAWTLEEVQGIAAAGKVDEILLPADEGMTAFDAAIVGAGGMTELAFGRLYSAESAAVRQAPVARLYTADGTFHGVAAVSTSGEIRPLKLLNLANSA
jgi:tRNA pseudouridine55 synthase